MSLKVNILYLEDYAPDAELVQRALQKAKIDFNMLVVDNEKDFIKGIQAFNPDIILADHSLPAFDSVSAFKIVREINLKIPFILITGTMPEESAVSIMMQGADDYILKDRLQRLPGCIIATVKKYRREREQEELQLKSRKRIEDSEKRYREIVETAQEGIWITNEKNDIVFANRKIGDILGYSVAEMLGKSCFYFMDEESRQSRIEVMMEHGCRSNMNYECRLVSKNNKMVWVSVSSNPLIKEDGIYNGTLSMLADITERKKADETLRDLNIAMKKTTAELEQSNKELERFAYIASHDLQEPLRMISSFLQRLQQKYDHQLDDTGRKYIHFATDGAERMRVLISDLLEFSRVSTVKKAHTIVDIKQLVDATLLNLKNELDHSGATIQTYPLPYITGNEIQLVQVFQNLISNSLKYRNHFKPHVEIGFIDEPDMWHFFVKDNGLGIDPEDHEKVFVIFQRLHNRSEYAGTGIGLSICKKIVELHGGRIWVESLKGQGSTFHFTLSKTSQLVNNP